MVGLLDLKTKEGRAEYARQWRKANPEKVRASAQKTYQKQKAKGLSSYRRGPEQARKYALRRQYGLAVEEYDQMFQTQDGRCAICKCKQRHHLAVDHDHATGAVRQLLCRACNSGLGLFKDNPDLLQTAASYLKAHAK